MSRDGATYSTMASRSAMSPSTMRWMMLLCSSSDRFLCDTSGVLYLVAGEGSTPCSQAWLSISSREALLFGSLWSIRSIKLDKRKRRKKRKETILVRMEKLQGPVKERHIASFDSGFQFPQQLDERHLSIWPAFDNMGIKRRYKTRSAISKKTTLLLGLQDLSEGFTEFSINSNISSTFHKTSRQFHHKLNSRTNNILQRHKKP